MEDIWRIVACEHLAVTCYQFHGSHAAFTIDHVRLPVAILVRPSKKQRQTLPGKRYKLDELLYSTTERLANGSQEFSKDQYLCNRWAFNIMVFAR